MTPKEVKDAKRIAAVVRAARKLSGKNQISLAQSLGISQGALSKIENGLLLMSSSQWFDFCEQTGLHSSETFKSGEIDNCIPMQEDAYPEDSFKLPHQYSHLAASKLRASKPYLNFFRTKLGSKTLEAYLKQVKVDPDLTIVLDYQINLKFNLELVSTLIHKGVLNAECVNGISQFVGRPEMHGMLRHRYSAPTSGITLLETFVRGIENYDANFRYDIEERTAKQLVLGITPAPETKEINYRSDDLGDFLCQYKKSYVQSFSTYHGGKAVQIEEKECHFHGASKCVYRVSEAR